MVTCRECEYEVNQATEICPHCGADLTLPTPDGPAIKKKLTLKQSLIRWGAVLGVMLGAIWSFVWFVATPRTGHVTLEAETQAVQSMDDIRSALSAYAAAQGGAYPSTLEPLGPPARQAAQLAQGEGYNLEYTPGPAGPDGAAHSYTLEARAGNFGYRNFYTDVSGALHSTSENRSATSSDPVIRP